MLLNLNPETVCQIIEKAREFQAKEGVTFTEDPTTPADPMQILADHRDDLTYQEVEKAISDLEPDQQLSLMAITYLGRGDFTVHEWHQALATAKTAWTPHMAEDLLADPLVPDYLEDGLELLGYGCNE